MNPAWRQSAYLPQALSYYRQLESEAGCQLFYPHSVLRLFSDAKESAKFERKKVGVAEWVEKEEAEIDGSQVHGCHGGFEMAQGGRLDTLAYLAVVRAKIEKEAAYVEADFSEEEVDFVEGGVEWREYAAKKLVLCQGYAGLREGWFSDLPHRSAKGEMLTVKVEQLDSDRILNRNGWMVPFGEGMWRAGATYEWDDLTTEPTGKGRAEVEKKVRGLTPLAFQTLKHEVGVRPIIQRSQPVIGMHPRFASVGFFNGLGSKGVTTAPSVAEHFAAVLEGEEELDPELSLARLA